MNGAERALPAEFAELDDYLDWALPTETARNHKRIDSSQAEIDAFANALIPRLDAICAYLDRLPLGALPEPGQRLMQLVLAVAESAPSVEGYRAPTVPYGYDSRRFRAQEGFPLRPHF